MKYDWLVIGAGFSGCVISEQIANRLNKKVLLVDKLPHLGGHCYDYWDEKGVLVHKYGPHIFHTNMKNVWNYLSCFTEWRFYEHRVLANVEGHKIPIPFNLNSISQLFPVTLARKFEKLLIDEFGYGLKVPILKLKENNNKDLQYLSEYIYKNIFKNYTIKQWNLKPEELDPSVTSRVPVYISRDNRYFQDIYQGIPLQGYAELFEKIISHHNIELKLNVNGLEIKNDIEYDKLLFTGPIDEFYNYKFGPLPYRSLNFETRHYDNFPYQECGQINYPNNYDFTRITEYGHLTGQKHSNTAIAIEYPHEYVKNINDPYYPIPTRESKVQFDLYANEAKNSQNEVLFTGRLADYKYYNMDQVVAKALKVFNDKINVK